MDKKYEAAKVQMDLRHPGYLFNPLEKIGCYSTITEAKGKIKDYKNQHPAEKYSYVIIDQNNGQLTYVEYLDYCLEKSD